MAQYGIVSKFPKPGTTTTVWKFFSAGSPQEDSELVRLLDHLGIQGWDVVGVGDFGTGQGDEIIMRR